MKDRITYLFMQYYTNKSTRKELEDFFMVINAAKNDKELNDLIKRVYNEIKKNNPSLTYINEAGKLVLREPDWLYEPEVETLQTRAKKRSFHVWPAAACLFVIVFGAVMLQKFNTDVVEIAVVQKFTERAEHKFLLLSDSTQVWLNASSTINYPEQFNGKKREVYLNGEAYFDVKHADKIPFVIHTGEVTTVVLGTAFNIKAYEGQQHITVSVKRGKVQVLKQDKVVFTLIKGQEIKINKKDLQQPTDKVIENNNAGSWQYGYLTYEDENFGDIISDMERVYNTEIILMKGQLEKLSVTTSFNRDIGAKKALEILCELTDSKLEIKNNQYLIK
ncbi:ferric-dicitrate binding protein FerR (iron transport regulator) [Pedobacter sp. AK017]|uniref:FecR family protein n=1 Tax=Pedobacter sp. AK017 TaxID=2723073 RepID=UPI00161EDCEE|nr:FecR family protein [Pedobacter sp. AK017]MBB5439021.1 ferric-dicitrate binding protein FerR (iron transport regulator) [Pedobacter sp. AK017]